VIKHRTDPEFVATRDHPAPLAVGDVEGADHADDPNSSDLAEAPGRVAVASPGAVVEMNHAVGEPAFVHQLELQADSVG